jgi:hypothetical protein
MSTAIITGVTDPADGGGGTAVRIKFDARVSVASKRGELPLDTIASVFVTNRDGCSYSEVPVDSNGMISVDFVMKPLQTDVKLTDRVKFHYFFRDVKDNALKPISAGHMPGP